MAVGPTRPEAVPVGYGTSVIFLGADGKWRDEVEAEPAVKVGSAQV